MNEGAQLGDIWMEGRFGVGDPLKMPERQPLMEADFEMVVRRFEFLMGELSMEASLDSWLPTFLPKSCGFQIHSCQGEHALLRKPEVRLRGYAKWLTSEHSVVVDVDRDGENCKDLKSRLEEICDQAGLRSKSALVGHDWQVVTHIAKEELEAWYFGDWHAVKRACQRVPANVPRKWAYRKPDSIASGTWEAFERAMKKHGYFLNGLSKVKPANGIGPHIDPTANSSQSIACFRDAICQALRCVRSP